MHVLDRARLAALLLAVLVSCSEATEARLPEVSAPPPADEASAFSGDGLPGPWWRRGASRADFKLDQRRCRDHSSAAREASEGDKFDAAYRAFLECMSELAWTRGIPPRKPIPAAMTP